MEPVVVEVAAVQSSFTEVGLRMVKESSPLNVMDAVVAVEAVDFGFIKSGKK